MSRPSITQVGDQTFVPASSLHPPTGSASGLLGCLGSGTASGRLNDEEEPLLKPSLARSRIFKLEGIFESFQYMAAKKKLRRKKNRIEHELH